MYGVVGRVLQTLPDGERVVGVASLDNLLYVLRDNQSSQQLEVYNTESYSLVKSFTVPGLGNASDMVACSHNRNAYIADSSNKCVLVLSRSAVRKWPVHDSPCCLSITDRHSLLVTCDEVRKIKEFCADGKLLREVTLAEDIVSPSKTIQLPTGEFILCHGGFGEQEYRICLTDSNGQVVKSYGGRKGAGIEQLNWPAHLAVDRNHFVFVADSNNRRVLLLSQTLTYIREVVSADQLNACPVRLCLDSGRSHMYVAVNSLKSGRVVVVGV